MNFIYLVSFVWKCSPNYFFSNIAAPLTQQEKFCELAKIQHHLNNMSVSVNEMTNCDFEKESKNDFFK